MPILRRFAHRSVTASMSAHTLVTIAPTVRQAIRIKAAVAVLEVWVASQATWWSKSRVCPVPGPRDVAGDHAAGGAGHPRGAGLQMDHQGAGGRVVPGHAPGGGPGPD